jgi:acetyltransferase-like isoleucine patch superfamily enzyme
MSPFKRISRRLSLSLNQWLETSRAALEVKSLPSFATPASGLVIQTPREIENPERIRIGTDVRLGPGAVLRARAESPGSWLAHPEGKHIRQTFDSQIVIGDRVTATGGLQLVAYDRITIEDEVMFASNIYISDGLHGFERGDIPYKYQGIFRIAPITIGYGSWVGQNVTVMPGVTIGRLCVIGAHSVVTKNIPDGSIAVGSPARVIKHWDAVQNVWTPVTFE